MGMQRMRNSYILAQKVTIDFKTFFLTSVVLSEIQAFSLNYELKREKSVHNSGLH